MNIIYVVPAISESSKGILKKQYDKIKAFENAGCHVKAFLFSESLDTGRTEGSMTLIPVKLEEIKKKYSKKLVWRALPFLLSRETNRIILETLKPHLAWPDLVYIRFSGTDINSVPLYKLIRKHGKKIAFEYNGNHLYDEKVNVKEHRSVFTLYKYFSERFFERKIAQYADVLIGVTHELTDYYSTLSPNSITHTLSNGIDASRFTARVPPPYDKKHIKYLFLSGSVNYWHGLDRFLSGLKKYDGDKLITLTIAGPISPEYKTFKYKNNNVQVHFLDSVVGAQLDELINTHHIGIGSLALHRMNLKEASVLKVREYIARGIPFILGYDDTDLQDSQAMTSFYMKVPADDSALDINSVIEFSDRVLSIENYPEKIRAIGVPLVDYQPKMNRLINALRKSFSKER